MDTAPNTPVSRITTTIDRQVRSRVARHQYHAVLTGDTVRLDEPSPSSSRS